MKLRPSAKLKQNGILLMIAASLFFSMMGALVKEATPRVPFMEAVFFRAFVSLVLLAPFMAVKRIPYFGSSFRLLFVRGASGFTALGLSFYVTSQIPLGNAAILNHTSTLFVALLSVIFLKEKVGAKLIIYILCALLGAGLIVKPDLYGMNTPGLLGLASGFFAAIAYISIKELHKKESFYTMVFNFSLISSAGALLFLRDFILPSFADMLLLIGVGLCGTIAQLLMTYSYKFTDASIVSPYAFSGVLFSFGWGILFWNEIPDRWSAVGALLIIACGIGIMRIKKSRGEEVIEAGDN